MVPYLDDVMDKKISSRGIPSKEAMWLPPHNSTEIRAFQNNDETPTRNLWSLEEVINFIFPKKYQERYHNIAHLFLSMLYENLYIDGHDIGKFIKEHNISKATFYNRVLPRLKRVGMVKVERVNVGKTKKYGPMRITLSKTFGNYLMKIADSWLAIVDDARTKKR